MLASHNSYTYLPSVSPIMNLFSGPWKCQSKSIHEQYASGVRYFDIRIFRKHLKNGYVWKVCHGIASLRHSFDSIEAICHQFENMDDVYYRIILERGGDEDERIFIRETETLEDRYGHFHWCVIKKDWKTIFCKNGLRVHDYCCKLNTLSEIISMIPYGMSIMTWAEINNPTLTYDMLNDNNNVYFIDSVP